MTSWTVLTLILNARTATSESVLSIGWGVVQNRQATCETALVTKFAPCHTLAKLLGKLVVATLKAAAPPNGFYQ